MCKIAKRTNSKSEENSEMKHYKGNIIKFQKLRGRQISSFHGSTVCKDSMRFPLLPNSEDLNIVFDVISLDVISLDDSYKIGV